MKSRIYEIIITILRVFLGMVFAIAAIPKMLDPVKFAYALNAYRILPAFAIGLSAWIIPWSEFMIGLLLITGYLRKLSFTLAGLLLLIFIIAVSSAMIRGLQIDCGCFGFHENVGWGVIARDIGLFVLLGVCILHYWCRSGKLSVY